MISKLANFTGHVLACYEMFSDSTNRTVIGTRMKLVLIVNALQSRRKKLGKKYAELTDSHREKDRLKSSILFDDD